MKREKMTSERMKNKSGKIKKDEWKHGKKW